MDIIDRLGQILDERDIDQGELESSCGLAHGRISKWKKGTGTPTAAQAARIARELGLSMEWLVEGRGDQEAIRPVEGLTSEENLILGLFRGSKLSVGDFAERVMPPQKPSRKRKRSPRKRRQG